MSTTPPTPNLWRRWLNFWFAPVDPTALGFIRLVAGFLVVYVHLAYCFDLRNFFGPDGWYGLEYVNRERRDVPTVLPPFWTWQEPVTGAHIPDYPHRKQAVMKWLRTLADQPGAKLHTDLHYLDRVVSQRDALVPAMDMLAYAQLLSADPAIRKWQLDRFVNPKVPEGQTRRQEIDVPVPKVLSDLPEEGANSRATVAREIEGLLALLPDDPSDKTFVLNYLIEMSQQYRLSLLQFVRELPTLSEAERQEKLDYLEYWNQERKFAVRTGNPIFSLWFHVTGSTEMYAAHTVILIIMVLFAVGFCTRVTSVLTWLAAASYIHRNQQVLFGMDTMMNIVLLYLMVGNSGAALSVDRLIARYRASRNSIRKHGYIDEATQAFLDKPPPSVSAGFAIRLLQVHFCFIYMASGLSKLKGPAWWNTNAYWDTLVNPEFTLIHYQWYDWLLRQLTSIRPLYQLSAMIGVGFTLVAEIGLPFLVWTRLRPFVVMMGFLLHAGIAIFMGLWIFSLMMMTMLLGYLPGSTIRERLFGTAGGPKLTVRINRKSERQQRAAALLRAMDFDAQVAIADGTGFGVEADGNTYTGPEAAREAMRRLTWAKSFTWVLRLPVVGSLATRLLTGAETGSSPAARPGVPAAS